MSDDTFGAGVLGALIGALVMVFVLGAMLDDELELAKEIKEATEVCEFNLPRYENCVMVAMPESEYEGDG